MLAACRYIYWSRERRDRFVYAARLPFLRRARGSASNADENRGVIRGREEKSIVGSLVKRWC